MTDYCPAVNSEFPPQRASDVYFFFVLSLFFELYVSLSNMRNVLLLMIFRSYVQASALWLIN